MQPLGGSRHDGHYVPHTHPPQSAPMQPVHVDKDPYQQSELPNGLPHMVPPSPILFKAFLTFHTSSAWQSIGESCHHGVSCHEGREWQCLKVLPWAHR